MYTSKPKDKDLKVLLIVLFGLVLFVAAKTIYPAVETIFTKFTKLAEVLMGIFFLWSE